MYSEPYSVTESGWGEFDINIKVYFVINDKSEESTITLKHYLRLFAVKDEAKIHDANLPTEFVLGEKYDELIYVDPPLEIYQKFKSLKQNNNIFEFSLRAEQEELSLLNKAINRVDEEIKKFKKRAKQTEMELQLLSDKKKTKKEKLPNTSLESIENTNKNEKKKESKKKKNKQ